MEIEIRKMKLEGLKPTGYNPRHKYKEGDWEYDRLRRSIETYGLVEPLIWNEETQHVVGGHFRLQVLQDLGWDTVDVTIVHLNEQQEKALNILLNNSSGSFEQEKLMEIIHELEGSIDLTLTGFSTEELDNFMETVEGHSYIEDLLTDSFVNRVQEQEYFQMTLLFKRENKEQLQEYIKEYGKEPIVQAVLEKIKGG